MKSHFQNSEIQLSRKHSITQQFFFRKQILKPKTSPIQLLPFYIAPCWLLHLPLKSDPSSPSEDTRGRFLVKASKQDKKKKMHRLIYIWLNQQYVQNQVS